jgi:hypothetical protein
MVRIGRLVIVAPFVAALGALTANAWKAGVVDSAVYRASVEMEAWAHLGTKPGPETWTWVHNDLTRALAMAPNNPNAHDLLGVLDLQRQDASKYLSESASQFERALSLRPTSPYTWADVAEVKYLQGSTDATFERALVRAAQLGPWEPEVQRTVADFGLAVWNEAGPNTRNAVAAMVANGMRRNPKEMLQIAQRRGRLAIACRPLLAEPRTLDMKWTQLCQGTEATS